MPIKQGVRIEGIQPELLLGHNEVQEIFRKYKTPLVITSVVDGVHMTGSLHYDGQAIDYRSKNIPTTELKQAILRECREVLGENYDFILESLGKPNEHFHLEFDPPIKKNYYDN